MAMISLETLKERILERADMPADSGFVPPATLTAWINASIAELHDLLVLAYGNAYFVAEDTFTTTTDTYDYDLPEDFYKLEGVDRKVGDKWETVSPYAFHERNQTFSPARYQIRGDSLRLSDGMVVGDEYRLSYIPTFTPLVDDADEANFRNGWEEYVIVDCAMKAKDKEESDVSVLMMQMQKMMRRITEMAENRNASEPAKVVDRGTWGDPTWGSF